MQLLRKLINTGSVYGFDTCEQCVIPVARKQLQFNHRGLQLNHKDVQFIRFLLSWIVRFRIPNKACNAVL